MSWQKVTAADLGAFAERLDDYVTYEKLVRDDDGAVLGWIERFHEDAPTYAHVAAGRIGPISGPRYGDGTVYANEFSLGSEGDAAARHRIEALAGKEVPAIRHRADRPPRCFNHFEV